MLFCLCYCYCDLYGGGIVCCFCLGMIGDCYYDVDWGYGIELFGYYLVVEILCD